MCRLGVIFQERLAIEVKLLLSANRKSHACHVDWHNNGWPWVTLNGCFTLSDTLKSTSFASRAISAVAELIV